MALPNRSTITSYNGYGKVNSGSIPPAFSVGVGNTDWDNPSLATAVSDVAALGQTAPRFHCRFTTATSTAGLVLLTWYAQWKNVTATTPVLARTSTGLFTITLPTIVQDEYDASVSNSTTITVNLIGAVVSSENGSTPMFLSAKANSNVITVQLWSSAGSASDEAGSNLFVVAY